MGFRRDRKSLDWFRFYYKQPRVPVHGSCFPRSTSSKLAPLLRLIAVERGDGSFELRLN